MRGTSIRTPDQRLRVFVSSTLAELAEERAAVREAIERVQLTPVLFELGARPHPPRELYRAYLEQSQIFVGIYWQRYGWVAPDETVSGLEDEYRLSVGMPRLLYVKAPAPDREERLTQLLGRIQSDDTASYKPFQTSAELARLVGSDLALLLSERFMSPAPKSEDQPPPAFNRPRHNLPVQLSSLVGREAELADVKRALADSRLVTLTGVGGTGKSRLALQAAGDLLTEYADGVWLVELAPLTEPERVPSAVAGGLAIPEDPSRTLTETLAEQLRSRHVLLVLDNCEHVLTACADLVASLLSTAPDLRVLATSREALGVPGEVVIPVPSLAVPGKATDVGPVEGFSAVHLFVERARAVRPDFQLTPASADAVAEIVRRLDGIPLAVELAAARVRVLSPEQIAARLSDRFRILSAGPRTAAPRQQTLRAAMDWSYHLLDEMEQHLLRRLSVFVGSCTLEAVGAVCGPEIEELDVVDVLSRLVDKSLVVVVQGPENRYRLLETVRQYGWERLDEVGETEAARAAHRNWCSSMVEAAAGQIRGGRQQARWLDLLELQHDDLHAALEWSWSRNDPTSLRIAVDAAWFWYLHGHWDDARRCLARSIAVEGAEPTLKARGYAWAGVFAWRRGDLDQASESAGTSLHVLAGTGDEGEGLSLLVHTLVAISNQDHHTAEDAGSRALEVFRSQNHRWGVTTSLLVLARIANNRRSGTLRQLLQESAPLVTSGDDLWGRVHLLTLQGYDAFRALDLDLARQLHSTASALAVELGDRAAQAENQLALAHIHLIREENDDAARLLAGVRALIERLHDPHDLGHVDQGLALLAVSRGDVQAGRTLLADVSRRFLELDKAAMGTAYAVGLADVYRRADRPILTAELLRHALSLLDETKNPEKYAQVREQLTAVEDGRLEHATGRLHPDGLQE